MQFQSIPFIEKNGKLRILNDYVINHFQSPISMNDIADKFSMNKTAFGRYFKKATDTNFFTYLNKISIGNAC